MLGVDVSRHQPSASISWAAWKNAGVSYCWVKGTDGVGLAPVERATRKVRDCKAAGIPVGLYGYAQLNNPRTQADVLVDEVIFQGADGVYCALDLEDPHTPSLAARNFAIAYLQRLKERGIARPVLYANTSMLKGIDSNTIRTIVPGTLIWCANYGANNGQRNTTQFNTATRGLHVDVWQYTSVGRLPGYSGNLDLNWAFNSSHLSQEENDVNLTDTIRFDDGREITVSKSLAESWQNSYDTLAIVRDLAVRVGKLESDVTDIKSRSVADVDEAALAAELDARGVGGMSVQDFKDVLATVRLTPSDLGGA